MCRQHWRGDVSEWTPRGDIRGVDSHGKDVYQRKGGSGRWWTRGKGSNRCRRLPIDHCGKYQERDGEGMKELYQDTHSRIIKRCRD